MADQVEWVQRTRSRSRGGRARGMVQRRYVREGVEMVEVLWVCGHLSPHRRPYLRRGSVRAADVEPAPDDARKGRPS